MDTKTKPFLKWVGGKRKLLGELKKRLPEKYNNYFEPFVGGGALFWEIRERNPKVKKFYLSDTNEDLIKTYLVIRNNVEKLIQELKKHESKHRKNPKEYYYKIRTEEPKENWQRAARFIYLNKTCFNGIHRVNSKGKFNVPMGEYKNPRICDLVNLRACHEILQGVNLKAQNYNEVKPKPGDFVYLDPPYAILNKSSFTKYAKQDFKEEDQIELANFCQKLDRNGVKIMVSNNFTKGVLELFSNKRFKIEKVNTMRLVSAKSKGRGKVKEVIITNY